MAGGTVAPWLSNFPFGFAQGVSIRGIPVLNQYGGQTFWVDSVNGNDGGPGTFQQPWATIGNAITRATGALGPYQPMAGRGDVIMVKAGHTETISSATALTLSVSGLQFIGLGIGDLRPTITLDTATTATINVTAANIMFQNFIFVANFAAIVAAFTLTTAKNFTLIGNEFRDNSSVLNFKLLVDTNTTSNDADGLTLIGNNWYGLGATSGSAAIQMDGTNTRLTFQGNYMSHAATSTAGFMPIASGKVVTNALVTDNIFSLTGAQAATTGILITTDGSTNSGWIARNLIQSLDDTSEILVTASSGFRFSQNYYAGAADKSGYLLPAADA